MDSRKNEETLVAADSTTGAADSTAEADDATAEVKVTYKFCDLQQKLYDAWNLEFKEYIPERVQVYKGDIFREGPTADAIVSPANSFGFMDGGIDMAYSRHFGWQMQDRLQALIRDQYDGELLVGQAAIITTVEHHNRNAVDWSKYNGGEPIKYLISAPTMRVPDDVSETCNAYLAFKAIILAVKKFNANNPSDPIKSVLCPGLGTAVGLMPRDRCAFQMLKAFERFDLRLDPEVFQPPNLGVPLTHHFDLIEYGGKDIKKGPPKDEKIFKSSNRATKAVVMVVDKLDDGNSKAEKDGTEKTKDGTEKTKDGTEKTTDDVEKQSEK